jgi:membrane peptidoglycan carboxypeptidase
MKRIQTYLVTKARVERRLRTRKIRRGITGKAGWGLAALLACVFSLAVIVVGWQFSQLTRGLPSIDQIPAQVNAQSATFTRPTRLIDRSGTQVVKDLALPGIQRKYMRLEGLGSSVSQDFINTLVALVEPNFWHSSGMDFKSLNPEEHGTIAQQLVYHLLLTQEPPTVQRALRERILAGQVISVYGREQVLEWYVNSLDFGHLAYGVEAGSRLYFGKSSAALDLPEAAMLAGVGVAPALNPWDSPAGARAIQVEALKALALQNKITTDTLRDALQVAVNVTPEKDISLSGSDAFAEQVVSELESILGRERVERGGLTIQTTLDFNLQQNLTCAVQAQLQALEGNDDAVLKATRNCEAARLLPLLPPGDPLNPGDVAASAVVSDPTTGQILALTGEMTSQGSSASENSHPAGTILAPFIYLNSFSQGLSPASLVWDAPSTGNPTGTVAQNLDGEYHGPVRIRIAMDNDYLQAMFSVLEQTGWYSLIRLTNSLGINLPANERDSAILDTPVTILDLTKAYGVLAADGTRYGKTPPGKDKPELSAVLKVWDENNQVIYDAGTPDRFGVISTQLAYLANSALSDDLARRPSLGSPSLLQLGQAAGAKIGQRVEGDHVWTAGYTPGRTVVVWVGKSQSAGDVKVDKRWAVGIWRAAIEYATEGLDNPGFRQPAGVGRVTVCDPSGLLPTEDCPSKVEELFIDGNEPVSTDTLYKKLQVNAETGRLATVFTPQDMVVQKVFMQIPAAYQAWAKKAGVETAPTSYDVVQVQSVDPAVHITSPEMYGYVHGKVDLIGTASSNKLASYEVQIGQGLNPLTWQSIQTGGSQPVVEGKLAVWDTTGLNGLYVIRLQVVDQDNVVKTALLQVSVDNTAPQVAIQLPADGAIIDQKSTPEVFIKPELTNSSDTVKVAIWIDGKQAAEIDSQPFFYNWKVTPGEHVIQVKAWDDVGNEGDSKEIRVEVE